MRIPSDSLIESVMSDIESHAGFDENKQSKESHLEECEVCQIMKEMSKRSDEAGENKLCQLDSLIWSISEVNPFVSMMCHTPGPGQGLVYTLVEVGRICFLLGMKAARSQDELKKMEETFGIEKY